MPFDPRSQFEVAPLPLFKPRRNQRRLDFRPVAWSLRNRPEEWEWADNGRRDSVIRHKPSNHRFWVFLGSFRLYDAACSCTSAPKREAKGLDWIRVRLAFRHWRRTEPSLRIDLADINRQFAAHFVTPSKSA